MNTKKQKKTNITFYIIYSLDFFRSLYITIHTYFQATPSHNIGYPSLLGQLTSQQLIHRLYTLSRSSQQTGNVELLAAFSPFTQDLPCEMHLLNLRSMQNAEIPESQRFVPRDMFALLLHRLGVDCSFPTRGLQCQTSSGKVNDLIYNEIEVFFCI